VLFGFAAALRRRFGWGALLLLCFSAGTLFPALGFLNVYPHRYSFVADHFSYLGSLGFLILYISAGAGLVAWLARRSAAAGSNSGRRGPRFAVATVVLTACGLLTFRQCFEYRDETTLWERTLAKNPDAWMAMVSLGDLHRVAAVEAVRRGRSADDEAARASAEAARTAHEQRAVALLERALSYPLARGQAHFNLALLANGRADREREMLHLRRAAEALDPGERHAQLALERLGALLVEAGKLDEAFEVLTRAAVLAPRRAGPAYNLALVYAARADLPKAADYACRAADLDPSSARLATTAGDFLMQLRQYDQARGRYRAAVRLDPANLSAWRGAAEASLRLVDCAATLEAVAGGRRVAADDPTLLFQLVWVRAACPAAEFRNGAEAVAAADRLRAVAGLTLDVADALAAAYAEAGDFAQAVNIAEQAAAAARQRGDADLAERITERLAGYRAEKAWRLRVGS
jgi:tetratricopeptide (TPR) repeat protein